MSAISATFLRLHEPPHLRDVGSDDVRRLLLDQLAVAVLAVEVLAGADRGPGIGVTLAWASMFSGGTGSSSQSRS